MKVDTRSKATPFKDYHKGIFFSPIFVLQVNDSRREMVRKDLGENIMEVSHNKGTDRWLVIKKQLDASNVRFPSIADCIAGMFFLDKVMASKF